MRIVMIILSLLELGRPMNAVLGVLSIFLGLAIMTGDIPVFIPLGDALAITVAGLMIVFSIMTINDVFDVEADKLNTPWRPIPSGRIDIHTALRASLVYAIIGLTSTLHVQPVPLTTITALYFLALANFYNAIGKKILLIGNIIVAFLTAFPLVYGVVLANYYLPGEWSSSDYMRAFLYWLMIFLSVLGREIAKGIIDVEGDLKVGVKTIANTYGENTAAKLASTLYISSVTISLIPPILGVVNSIPYLTVIIPIDIIVVYESIKLVRSPTKVEILNHKKRILILMFISMIGLYLGSHGV
ncbi:MAG: geranylgeranylglycerol-phosphate geranylgeranyltransferase [Acidilobaceae archaeon]